MYDIAKKARSGMKAKAERLAGEKDRKVDSSDWSPAPALNADVKTGMRPISRQARKAGGKVMGEAGKQRADRKPRKAGGRVESKGEQPLVDRYINRDLKKANDYRDGVKHDGGLKRGGRAAKANGGKLSSDDAKKLFKDYSASKQAEDENRLNLEKKGSPTGKILQPKQALSLESSALKRGGRAAKADGGSMSVEEMIAKNPAPAKKPLGLDKVPLPPRRPQNNTTAVPNPKPDASKALTGDDVTGPPKYYGMKKGGRAKHADGGKVGDKKRTPGTAVLEKYEQEIRNKFSPEYFANLKSQRKKELSEDKGYQGFASRRADKDDDTDAKCYGGRAKKADGGPMQVDPRLGIVSPKAMNFSQNLVTPGLKKGGRVKKDSGGAAQAAGAAATPSLAPVPVSTSAPNPMPTVGSGLLPPSTASYTKGPTYDAAKYNSPAATTDKKSKGGDYHDKSSKDSLDVPKVPGVKKGGRVAKADGGSLMMGEKPKAKSAKGKTNINIIIAAGKTNKPEQTPMAPMGAGAPPMTPPAPMMGAGAPPQMGGPAMPPMAPPAGPGKPPMPMPPMPRKAGGRVSKVAHSFKDMTAGAGSGEGRLQKTDIAKRAPRKSGGKVYRSYKDMDAGAGSGTGRLEKTEIQSRKK